MRYQEHIAVELVWLQGIVDVDHAALCAAVHRHIVCRVAKVVVNTVAAVVTVLEDPLVVFDRQDSIHFAYVPHSAYFLLMKELDHSRLAVAVVVEAVVACHSPCQGSAMP